MPSTVETVRDFTDTLLSGARKGQDLALAGLDMLPTPQKLVDVAFDLTKTVVTTQVDLGRSLVTRVTSAN
jgi:hypothetical protein